MNAVSVTVTVKAVNTN